MSSYKREDNPLTPFFKGELNMKNISGKIQVMIVEDDPIYRDSIQTFINDNDDMLCDHACESCEDAIKILKKGYAPEIILLDIELPGISGIEGIKEFKSLTPATHIIMLTVFDDDDKIFNAICEGAEGYLLKTSISDNISEYIKDVMLGGAAMNPWIAAKVLKMFSEFSESKKEYGLTDREKEILKLLVNGMNKKHIAEELHISLLTINTHLKNIYAKLHVHSQVDVVAKALKERLI